FDDFVPAAAIEAVRVDIVPRTVAAVERHNAIGRRARVVAAAVESDLAADPRLQRDWVEVEHELLAVGVLDRESADRAVPGALDRGVAGSIRDAGRLGVRVGARHAPDPGP